MGASDVEPYDAGFLATGDGHEVHWEAIGNPAGLPAVVLHGGPGSGATPYWRDFFDPDRYRVVLFDQRGCGRSRPHAGDDLAALEENTTDHLVDDMESLRRLHGIERWLLLGASWGSTLGLSYAVRHPERVSALVFWALVTTRARDVDWLTHVMGDVYPAEFDELLAILPGVRRPDNVPAAVHELLRSDDVQVRDSAARAWCAWEDRIATLTGPVQPDPRFADPRFRLGFARLVTHYFAHAAFQADDAITGRLHRLEGIPSLLVRGRLDIASPLRSALEVAQGIRGATLEIVEGDAHAAGRETRELVTTFLRGFGG